MNAAMPAEARPTVAVFDFDGTVVRGGSNLPFLLRVRGPVAVALATLKLAPKLLKGAILSGAAADESKEALYTRLLGGVREADVRRIAASFAESHVRRRLRPEVRARLEWHRRQGHKLLLVSASPEFYVRPAGELLGVDDVLATRLAVGGGLLTGRFEGKNCRGAEKYARVVGWLRASGLAGAGTPQPALWAYGNSRGDLRLLSAADVGVDAGHLGRLGRLRRFPRLGSLGSLTSAGQAQRA